MDSSYISKAVFVSHHFIVNTQRTTQYALTPRCTFPLVGHAERTFRGCETSLRDYKAGKYPGSNQNHVVTHLAPKKNNSFCLLGKVQ